MKRLILFSLCAAGLLLSGCGGVRTLTRMNVDRLEQFRVRSMGLGSVEGTARTAFYNGNKKSVTFGLGRFELQRDGRTVAVATLLAPVTVTPGHDRVELPVRIRFSQEALRSMLDLMRKARRDKAPEQPAVWRLAGEIGIDPAEGERPGRGRQRIRFRLRVDDRMLQRLEESLLNAAVFNLMLK